MEEATRYQFVVETPHIVDLIWSYTISYYMYFSFLPFFYAIVDMDAYILVVCVHADTRYLLHLLFFLFFETESFTHPGAHWFEKPGWPAKPIDLDIPAFLSVGLQCACFPTGMFSLQWVLRLNSDFHALILSISCYNLNLHDVAVTS